MSILRKEDKKGLAIIIVCLGLIALAALISGCTNPATYSPSIDRGRPAIVWRF